MQFRPITDGGRVAAWVRALAGKSGVYVIRKPGLVFSNTLYVGESHTGRLKKTILRHFQHWKGKTAGPRFDRAKVLVGVVVTKPAAAVGLQDRLIEKFDPVNNRLGKPETPF